GVVTGGGQTRKLAGRIARLRGLLAEAPVHGSCGIGHTRWATHGAPTERNAHPHTDCDGTLALVHNGIIENADVLRTRLERAGHRFTTETDTETLAHLIEDSAGETLEERVMGALGHVEGTYGIAVVSEMDPGKIVVARRGSPVLLGVGDGGFLGEEGTARLNGLNLTPAQCSRIRRIVIVACGTSWHAGLVGRQVLEELVEIPVSVEYASEYRYRRELRIPGTLTIAISQSGETADTLEALRAAKAAGSTVIGLVNVVGSTIAREADGGIYLHAGPEIGVASTKAF